MRLTRYGFGGLALSAVLFASACGGPSEPVAPGGDKNSDDVKVVATTTMLGDVTQRVVQCVNPEASVTTLMPVGADPHEFSVSSKDATEIVKADLVVANGLGLEGGLTDVLESAKSDGAEVLEVASEVDPIPFDAHGAGEEGHDHEHGHDHEGHDHEHEGHDHEHGHDHEGHDHEHEGHDHEGHDHEHEGHDHEHEGHDHEHEGHDHEGHGHEGHHHGTHDPHFWFDAARMATGAEVIGEHLKESTGDDKYAECGATVKEEITETDEQVREKLASIPEDKRKLVTDHDAFGYFAKAYDFEVIGTVIPGGSTEAEPSAQEISDLVSKIKSSGVPAIFSNNAVKAPVVEAVGKEVGGDVKVVQLSVGSLGEPGSPAGTYEGMMLDNADKIAEALG